MPNQPWVYLRATLPLFTRLLRFSRPDIVHRFPFVVVMDKNKDNQEPGYQELMDNTRYVFTLLPLNEVQLVCFSYNSNCGSPDKDPSEESEDLEKDSVYFFRRFQHTQ